MSRLICFRMDWTAHRYFAYILLYLNHQSDTHSRYIFPKRFLYIFFKLFFLFSCLLPTNRKLNTFCLFIFDLIKCVLFCFFFFRFGNYLANPWWIHVRIVMFEFVFNVLTNRVTHSHSGSVQENGFQVMTGVEFCFYFFELWFNEFFFAVSIFFRDFNKFSLAIFFCFSIYYYKRLTFVQMLFQGLESTILI